MVIVTTAIDKLASSFLISNAEMALKGSTMNSRQIIKQLEANGWSLRSVRGSHHVFTHPSKPGHISVPHPKQDLGVGLAHKLLKQAGLK